jgi:hypothetical protein
MGSSDLFFASISRSFNACSIVCHGATVGPHSTIELLFAARLSRNDHTRPHQGYSKILAIRVMTVRDVSLSLSRYMPA